MVGCPRIDLVKSILGKKPKKLKRILSEGVGQEIEIEKPFILISQHPVTTEYDTSEEAILNTLEAVKETGQQAICLWPNSDAGSDLISRELGNLEKLTMIYALDFLKISLLMFTSI